MHEVTFAQFRQFVEFTLGGRIEDGIPPQGLQPFRFHVRDHQFSLARNLAASGTSWATTAPLNLYNRSLLRRRADGSILRSAAVRQKRMDRLTAMETFVSVIETGSFSADARRMNVGQPAVSKSIAQLEAKLGVPLFVRSTRGLTPTEAGQRFYERAKAAIDTAEDAEAQARGTGTSLSGTLRVCAPVTFARLHIVPQQDSD